MNKLRLTTCVMSLALTCAITYARSLTPDEALSMVSSQALKIKGNNKLSMQLSYTQKTPLGGENALYVFANADSKGFAVIAADDAVGQLLLGYSDTETFDTNNMPPAMQAWMDAWAYTIQASAQSGEPVSTVKSGRQDVAPIVMTKWGQGTPYNDKCPIVEGKRSVTGCVATSIAQVMNFHQWPETGQGTVSYDWTVQGTTYNASLDFSTVTFDWDAMLDTYDQDSSQEACDAVATLMYACGVGAHMDYTPDESGASEFQAANALINNFGYDIGLQMQLHQWYTDEGWDDLLYEELADGRPISFGGVNEKKEGHQFVIDGYDTGGYFHVNWGWDGMSDGYFKINALDPAVLGTGGGSGNSGFNIGQDAMIKLQKPVQGSQLYAVMGMDEMTTDAPSYSRGSGTWIQIMGGFYSYALDSWDYLVGVHVVGQNVDAYISSSDNFETLETLSGYSAYWVNTAKFPVGEYDVYPAFKPQGGEWEDMKYPVRTWAPLHFTVTTNDITVTNPNAQGSAYASYVGYEPVNGTDDSLYTGRYYNFTYDIVTDGKWEGNTQVLLLNGNTIYAVSESQDVEFSFADKQTHTYKMQIDPGCPAGQFELMLSYKTENGYYGISSRNPVEVVESPISGSGVVSEVTFKYSANSGKGENSAAVMVKDAAEVSITLKATDAPWQDDVWIYFANTSLSIIGQTDSQPINIETKGGTTVLTFSGPWDELQTGTVYAMAPWAKGAKQLCNPYYFKLVETGSAAAELIFVGSEGDGLNELAVLNADNQVIEAKIYCEQAPWQQNLTLIFANRQGDTVYYTNPEEVSFEETGSTMTLRFEGPWDGIENNTLYQTSLCDTEGNPVSKVYAFQVAVVKRTQTITWDQELDEVEEGAVITLTASASSGLDIQYEVTKGTDIVTLEGNTLTVNGEGEIEITASQPGNDEYEAAEPVCKTFWAKAGILSAISDRLSIKTEGNVVTLSGLKVREIVSIYTTDGCLVYTGTDSRITLQHNQTYLLVVGSLTTKLHTR